MLPWQPEFQSDTYCLEPVILKVAGSDFFIVSINLSHSSSGTIPIPCNIIQESYVVICLF